MKSFNVSGPLRFLRTSRKLYSRSVLSPFDQHRGSHTNWDSALLTTPAWLFLLSLAAIKSGDVADSKAKEEDNIAYTEAVCGVSKYAANKPIEDRHFVARLNNGGWWFSIFDGHGGWQCSEYAHKKLHKNVQVELYNHLGSAEEKDDDGGEDQEPLVELGGKVSVGVVERALKAAFERTDRQYMTKVYGAFELGFGRDTRAGSCALGVFVLDETMYVANAGDSRAVVGINREALDKESSKSLQRQFQENPGAVDVPGRNVTLTELDEDLEIAALRQSTGEATSEEDKRRLREKLLARLFVDEAEDEEEKAAEEERREMQDLVNSPHDRNSPSRSYNPLVNAVTFLTGGGARRPASSSQFLSLEMSNDHNCKLASERKKLEAAHEGEADVVMCKSPNSCYVKGKLQPTRALGDFYLKYSEFMRKSNEDSSAGRYIPPPYTPPYIKATPEVKVRKLVRGRDDFLVIASDGLWDMMSSQEVVELAGYHLRTKGESVEKVCNVLITEALSRAAKNNNLTLEKLKSLRPGRLRRSKHDDITVIVVDLTRLLNLYYWG